ncbi:hypothetical protein [uncultured Cloacibacillus sp.]|uniref:hypothetical protein n=1 Tax=uncultured Cloacibacillus sp. TaxID=889794 RepID=UPI0026DC27CC|nr:hypothetical protein [uncultured Cloacibacillus sp.]
MRSPKPVRDVNAGEQGRKKYREQEIDADDPPIELLLAKGVLAMYGQIILKRAKQKYGLPKKYLKIAIDLGMRFPELEKDD